MSTQYIFLVVNGISIGIALFLAAAGLTILFGVLKVVNFSHGSFIMVGAYLSSTILGWMSRYGVAEFLVIAVVVGMLVGVLGVLVDRVVFRRLHGVDEAVALIATFALMLVINGGVELIWGAQSISVDVPQGLAGSLSVGRIVFPSFSVLLFIVGMCVFFLLDLFLARSWTGKTLQAISEDRWVMDILGHSPQRLQMLAVFVAFFLAGFCGGVLGPNQILTPDLGNQLIIEAFAVVVVGGLGSIRGAFLAAMLLGFAESFGSIIMPSLSLYVGMIVILILRPQGLIAPRMAARSSSWSVSWLWEGVGENRLRKSAPVADRVSARANILAVPADVRPRMLSAEAIGTIVVIGLALVSVPSWAGAGIIFLLSLALISTILSMSWNLMFGFGGMASFGHAAFFAVGAYVSAYFLRENPNVPFILLMVGAPVLGAIVAFPIGIIALRRATGVQLGILTLALAEVLRVLISYTAVLGRDEGLSAVPRPRIGFAEMSFRLGSDAHYYLFLCVACGSMILLLWAISHGRFGRTLRSIRQDAQRAMFLGINVDRFRLLCFMMAAAVAAYAGALSAPLTQIVTPQTAGIANSTEPMLHTLLGGASSFWGPAVGTAIFAAIDYSTRSFPGLSEFIMGITILIVVLLAPGGAVGLFDTLRGVFRRGAEVTEPAPKSAAEDAR